MHTRRLVLSLAVLPLLPAAAAAQGSAPPPLFSSADGAAATATIHRYFAAFTARDFNGFRGTLNAPFVMAGQTIRIVATVEEAAQGYERLRADLDKMDYAASQAAEIRLTPLHASSVLAEVHWQRLKKNGGLLNEGAEVLVLAKVDSQWKITGNLGEDLREFRARK